MKNETWKGSGFCKSRHKLEHDDFCNRPVDKNGEYCRACTCSVQRCQDSWSHLWPLLGDIRLCSKHYKNPPEKYKKLVSDSQAPPDDFDYPE
jgi:hypothetical protein